MNEWIHGHTSEISLVISVMSLFIGLVTALTPSERTRRRLLWPLLTLVGVLAIANAVISASNKKLVQQVEREQAKPVVVRGDDEKGTPPSDQPEVASQPASTAEYPPVQLDLSYNPKHPRAGEETIFLAKPRGGTGFYKYSWATYSDENKEPDPLDSDANRCRILFRKPGAWWVLATVISNGKKREQAVKVLIDP